jgi:hypothetical protein
MLGAVVFFIPFQSAFTSSRLDLICNATAEVLREARSGPISRVGNAPPRPSGMLRKFCLLTLLAASTPLFADTLISGSIYFDSQKTLEEVVKLSAAKDNESILKLINSGHVSQQTEARKDIIILTTGLTSESPAEFRFTSDPTTYWTLAKFVIREAVVEPTPTPAPEQSPTPMETSERGPGSTRTKRHHLKDSENDDPADDDNGQRIWHKVNGRWKWYPAHQKSVKKALPSDQNPGVAPDGSSSAPNQ